MIATLRRYGDPAVPTLKKDLLVRLTEYDIRDEQPMEAVEEKLGGKEEEAHEEFDDESNNDVDPIIMNDIQEALV